MICCIPITPHARKYSVEPQWVLFLCAAGFLAAFVDSIAGGGGLISLPALLAAGVPPHLSLGTNKFASTCASFTSTLKFAKSGKILFPLVRWQIPCTALGAALGVHTVLRLEAWILQTLIAVLVFGVALYTVFRKDFGKEDRFAGLTKGTVAIGMLFAFLLGFYDGFFGPGTGSFLIFLFIRVFGFDFAAAAGNAKILNFTSNVISLILFAIGGSIRVAAGLPMALFMIAGAWVGTHVAVRNGSRVIKPIFVTIALALMGKLVWQML